MKRLPSISATVAAAVILLTSAMVLAQAQRGGQAGREERMRLQRLRALANQLRPFYRYELMHARTACKLTREQLRAIRPELDAAYDRAIARIDASRREGQGSASSGEGIDYTARIRENVLAVVSRHATAEQLSACRDDLQLAETGRREAAIDFLIAAIDRELLLGGRQREQIAGALASGWDVRWYDVLELALGGHQVYPDVPDRLIVPHLSPSQRDAWHRLPKSRRHLWGVAIDQGGGPEMELELGEDPKTLERPVRAYGTPLPAIEKARRVP
jgi:hypothetical protein